MKILVAVSGGVDSVVLLDLFARKKLEKFTYMYPTIIKFSKKWANHSKKYFPEKK